MAIDTAPLIYSPVRDDGTTGVIGLPRDQPLVLKFEAMQTTSASSTSQTAPFRAGARPLGTLLTTYSVGDQYPAMTRLAGYNYGSVSGSLPSDGRYRLWGIDHLARADRSEYVVRAGGNYRKIVQNFLYHETGGDGVALRTGPRSLRSTFVDTIYWHAYLTDYPTPASVPVLYPISIGVWQRTDSVIRVTYTRGYSVFVWKNPSNALSTTPVVRSGGENSGTGLGGGPGVHAVAIYRPLRSSNNTGGGINKRHFFVLPSGEGTRLPIDFAVNENKFYALYAPVSGGATVRYYSGTIVTGDNQTFTSGPHTLATGGYTANVDGNYRLNVGYNRIYLGYRNRIFVFKGNNTATLDDFHSPEYLAGTGALTDLFPTSTSQIVALRGDTLWALTAAIGAIDRFRIRSSIDNRTSWVYWTGAAWTGGPVATVHKLFLSADTGDDRWIYTLPTAWNRQNNTVHYFQIQTRSNNVWSDWSATTQIRSLGETVVPTVTITSPVDGEVINHNQVVAWTASNQAKSRIRTRIASTGELLQDSGIGTSTPGTNVLYGQASWGTSGRDANIDTLPNQPVEGTPITLSVWVASTSGGEATDSVTGPLRYAPPDPGTWTTTSDHDIGAVKIVYTVPARTLASVPAVQIRIERQRQYTAGETARGDTSQRTVAPVITIPLPDIAQAHTGTHTDYAIPLNEVWRYRVVSISAKGVEEVADPYPLIPNHSHFGQYALVKGDVAGRGLRIYPVSDPESGVWVRSTGFDRTQKTGSTVHNFAGGTRRAVIWDITDIDATIRIYQTATYIVAAVEGWINTPIVAKSVRGEVVHGMLAGVDTTFRAEQETGRIDGTLNIRVSDLEYYGT